MKKSHLSVRDEQNYQKKMYKRFSIQNNTVYIDILPKIYASYNNSKNRSIGMTPNEAREPENYGRVYWNLYGDLESQNSGPAF